MNNFWVLSTLWFDYEFIHMKAFDFEYYDKINNKHFIVRILSYEQALKIDCWILWQIFNYDNYWVIIIFIIQ